MQQHKNISDGNFVIEDTVAVNIDFITICI